MPRGGARPGAGRKPRAEKYARPIATAEKRIVDRLPQLLERLFELADGVTVQEEGLDGDTRVYSKAPNRLALQYLVDRILGKPVALIETTGEAGGPLRVRVEYEDVPGGCEDPSAEATSGPGPCDPGGAAV